LIYWHDARRLWKQNFIYSFQMMMALTVFGIAGLCVGLLRGGSLKYEIDSDEKMYYKESYLSLLIYILVIILKCSYISYRYLSSGSL